MRNRKVELLAPAGNYDSFIAAINAGADAVYVGGDKFSARAYADNFDTQTLCECIKYAHLLGRRVYLTLNTLIKESEFSEIYDYVKPFYLAGLDGVIIQDFGVLSFLKRHFPNLELHASTQMAITGKEFVEMCQEWGISRVVPARELSLKELKSIHDAGVEVECFIHGAMCYCYSGMCLMSSILGGRSGNRGKCAQPCRLPYQVSNSEQKGRDTYTLSLKDMCTIEHIPDLIEAGMDSFKIEGRMKRSEYAAGVTALYRKYIDQFYANPDKRFRISDEDRYILERLYMRSELHDGYLFKHNGKGMVTQDAPSYSGLEDEILSGIRQKYLGYTQKLPVSVYGYFEVGQESVLTVCTDSGITVTVNGPSIDSAIKAPATKESVTKQLEKFGNTHFTLKEISVSVVGNAFLPNGILNSLRREAVQRLETEIIHAYFPKLKERLAEAALDEWKDQINYSNQKVKLPFSDKKLTVLAKTAEQLQILLKHAIVHNVDSVYLEDEAMEMFLSDQEALPEGVNPIYAMPYVLREKDEKQVEAFLCEMAAKGCCSVLVRNVEELALVNRLKCKHEFSIITDASLYCWNHEAKSALSEYASRLTLPFELNSKEVRCLRSDNTEQVIYGHIPLMVTANCIFKTNYTCKIGTSKTTHSAFLKDRYGKVFTVLTNCKYCYNIIYNSVPLSLHKKYNKSLPGMYRLQFSIEDGKQMKAVLDYYIKWQRDDLEEFPIKEYTTAHENRQVE